MIKVNDFEFKSELQHIKDIEERNVQFKALNKKQKCKEIAYDCLLLTLGGKVCGSYQAYWSDNLEAIEKPDAKAFQEKLVNKLPKCSVCARGGMMLSQIRLGNSIHSNEYYRCKGDVQIIQGFTMSNFLEMEDEYERNTYKHPYKHNTTKKLQNICLNVIHNGKFNTDDPTDYLKDLVYQNQELITIETLK